MKENAWQTFSATKQTEKSWEENGTKEPKSDSEVESHDNESGECSRQVERIPPVSSNRDKRRD